MESRPSTSKSLGTSVSLSAEQAALEAVEEVGPRSYRLITKNPAEEVRFFVLGCHGSGKASQKETAQLMKNIAAQSPDKQPQFILFLGDNVYDYGVTNPSHPDFNTCFYNMYGKLPPCFMLLGNHDGNYHAKYSLYKSRNPLTYVPQGRATEINQVAHTYLGDTVYLKSLFKQETLDIASLPQWVMPYFFYSISIGNLVIFCINSNSYAKDYLALLNGNTNASLMNQAHWLKAEYNHPAHAGKTKMLALHHPLYTSGKRAIPEKFDNTHYLGQNEIDQLKETLGIQTNSYNALLAAILLRQGLAFDCVLAAHDHFISFYNNRLNKEAPNFLCQFTAGGGGGDLQTRESFAHHPYVGCHLKQNGFGMITLKKHYPNAFSIDVFTTENWHLKFTQADHRPIQQKSENAESIKLQSCIITAAYEYLTKLKESEISQSNNRNSSKEYRGGLISNIFWAGTIFYQHWYHDPLKTKEILCVQHLMAYFQQVELPDFSSALNILFNFTKDLPKLSDHHFVVMLDNRINLTFGTSLPSLFDAYLLLSSSELAKPF